MHEYSCCWVAEPVGVESDNINSSEMEEEKELCNKSVADCHIAFTP
jgi:hypothetical protein